MYSIRVSIIFLLSLQPCFGDDHRGHHHDSEADHQMISRDQLRRRDIGRIYREFADVARKTGNGEVSLAQIDKGVKAVLDRWPELEKMHGKKIPSSFVAEIYKTTFGVEPTESQLKLAKKEFEEVRHEILHSRDRSRDGDKGKDTDRSDGNTNKDGTGDRLPGQAYNDPTRKEVSVINEVAAAKNNSAGRSQHPDSNSNNPGGAVTNSATTPSNSPSSSNNVSTPTGITASSGNTGPYLPALKSLGNSPALASPKIAIEAPLSEKDNLVLSKADSAQTNPGIAPWHPLSAEGAPKLPEPGAAEANKIANAPQGAQSATDLAPLSTNSEKNSLDQYSSTYRNSLTLFESNIPVGANLNLLGSNGMADKKDSLLNPSQPNKYAPNTSELATLSAGANGSSTFSSSQSGGSTPASGTTGGNTIGTTNSAGVIQGVQAASPSKLDKPTIVSTLGKVFDAFKKNAIGLIESPRGIASGDEDSTPSILGTSLLKVEQTWNGLFKSNETEGTEIGTEIDREEDANHAGSQLPLALGGLFALAAAVTAGESYRRYRIAKSAVSEKQSGDSEQVRKGA